MFICKRNLKIPLAIWGLILFYDGYAMSRSNYEPEETKAPLKKAWQEAKNGNFAHALEQLTIAATGGNLIACTYLAQGYQKGTLITPLDPDKGKHFAQKFEELTQQRKHLFTEKYEPTVGMYWYEQYIKSVKEKIERKDSSISSALCARNNPSWYQFIIQRVAEKEHNESRPFSECKKKTPKIPSPEKAVCRLLEYYYAGKCDEKEISSLKKGIETLNSPLVYKHILTFLNSFSGNISSEEKLHLIFFVQEWALQNNKNKELEPPYLNYIYHYSPSPHNEKKESENARILKILPAYHRVNPDGAMHALKYFSKKYRHISSSDSRIDNRPSFKILLEYLTCARQLHPETFEKLSQKIISENLANFLSHALENPEMIATFESSPLALHNLINKTFENADRDIKSSKEAFEAFIKKGTQQLHELYQEHITRLIPLFLQAYPYAPDCIIHLVASPIATLRRTAFDALTKHFSSPEVYQNTVEFHSYNLTLLLKTNLNRIIDGQDEIDAYHSLYKTFKENTCIASIQVLWKYLSNFSDEKTIAFLAQTMADFFELDEQLLKDHRRSFKIMLNHALESAAQRGTLPPLRAFLIYANKTGLVEKINPQFLEHHKSMCIFQEDSPLEERCQFLNDLISIHLIRNEDLNSIHGHIESLPDSRFKEYGKTLLATLKPKQTFYDYFSNRRKLHEFHTENPAFDSEPAIIAALPIRYFNGFGLNGYGNLQETTKNKKWISISNTLRNPKLDNGILLGYVATNIANRYYTEHEENTKRLYACNANDGYAVWAAPVACKDFHPFVVTGDAVYCPTDDHHILILDKQNGFIKEKISLPIQKEIENMVMMPENTLALLQGNEICFITLETEKDGFSSTSYTLPKEVIFRKFVPCGNRLIFPMHHKETNSYPLLALDKNGTSQIIETNVKDLLFANPAVAGTDDTLFYVRSIIKEAGDTLVAHDMRTGKTLWEYPLESKLSCAPKLSKSGDLLFLLTEKQLSTIPIKQPSSEIKQAVWSISNESTERSGDKIMDQLLVADDGETLYALNYDLHKITIQTGSSQCLGKVSKNNPHLIGVENNKIYIRS